MGKLISRETFEKVTKTIAMTDQVKDIGEGIFVMLMIRLWTGTLRKEEIADTELDEIATMLEEAAVEIVGDFHEDELESFLALKDETDIWKDKLQKLIHEMDGA